jgi:DNA polymerase-4
MERVILHSDLNSFYASVECLYNPQIRDKPVAVCGSQSTRHGIVLARNMLAKKYGVKTAEPVWEAKGKCPELVVVRPNYPLYLKFSVLARKIYENYTSLVESFGIDESWLDVTESTRLFGSGERIAGEIRERIREELGITVSIGVSFNKIFAKLGSDMKKPDAVTVISQEDFKRKIWKLPAEDMLYVGRSTASKLGQVGILTIGDLANAPLKYLTGRFGKWGETLWIFANGYDATPVTKTDFEPVIKGIGNSLTTPRDLTCISDVRLLAYVLSDSVGERLRRHNLKGKTVQISIRDSSLAFTERQSQLPAHTYISAEIAEKAVEIFSKSWDWSKTIRSFGIRVTDLVTADTFMQLSLFDDERRMKKEMLDRSIDRIRARFGHYSVQRALLLCDGALNANPAEENIIHPISYFR